MNTRYKYKLNILMALLLTSFSCLTLCSCEKFLAEKTDQKMTVPATLDDVQALLNTFELMNNAAPEGAKSDDDFFYEDSYFASLDLNRQNTYTWQKDVYLSEGWRAMYPIVAHSNMSIEILNTIPKTSNNSDAHDAAYGSALFYRSFAFHQLSEIFGDAYDEETAATKLSIPLRVDSDVNAVNRRNTIQETYDRIIMDVNAALPLLPDRTSLVSKPSKAAAYALLSNVYLTMRKYDKAGKYADSTLQLHATLLNYNNHDPSATTPFQKFNNEMIYASRAGASVLRYTANAITDTLLYNSYEEADLRKVLFFQYLAPKRYGFKGSYWGTIYGDCFNGYAVDEMLLIRAESAARDNRPGDAMNDLNTLLVTRYKTGQYIPRTAATGAEALQIVLEERRKELIGRAKRWSDLRRLNKEPAFQKTLVRKIQNQVYELLPNSPRYTFYIPADVIAMSGMPQNER